jgi:tRNA dimethylallyltransferase
MNIGTDTPAREAQDGIPHYNLSIIDPAQKDSAANFYRRAMEWEKEIRSREQTVLYVGGSTLHQRCIIQPFDDIPDANEEHLAELEQEIADKGIEPLFERLKKVDPKYAAEMEGMNTQRIIRALDVWMQTGRAFSSFHTGGPISPPKELLVIGLHRDRQKLYNRINLRVDQMFEQGFLDEVQSILEMGYSLDDPGLNTVGYKEAIAYLNDELSREQMVKDMKTQTRRYSKRQMTYFKRWDFVEWINADEYSPEEITQKILNVRREKAKGIREK